MILKTIKSKVLPIYKNYPVCKMLSCGWEQRVQINKDSVWEAFLVCRHLLLVYPFLSI